MVQLDLPCLRNMVRLLMSFSGDGKHTRQGESRCKSYGVGEWSNQLKKARETLGRDVFHQIPNDYRTMIEMRNNGVPLIVQAPKAPITESILELTRMLSNDSLGAGEASEGDRKSVAGAASWMSFFNNRSKAKK